MPQSKLLVSSSLVLEVLKYIYVPLSVISLYDVCGANENQTEVLRC
jgi:hypothetical protein